MRKPIKQGVELDLALRQTYLGTSEWAVITGLYNAYKSPYDVYVDKVHGYDPVDNLRMKLGRDIEPMIAKWVEEELGGKVAQDSLVRFHKDYDYLATNLDGVYYDKDGDASILEIKTASTIAREKWGAELPIQYYTQIQGQMLITGMTKTYVAILTFGFAGPEKFEIQEYDYDESFINLVVPKLVDFWTNHVEKEIAPEFTTESDVKNAYPEANNHSIEATSEIIDAMDRIKDIKAKKKVLDQELKSLELDIKKEMKDAHSIIDGDQTLATWKNGKPRKTFDKTLFIKDHADLYEKYIKTGDPYRTLRIK
tara:strand:+ start:5977 stop:6906 length:930 start_codon:yes stop_codon:yes gene_type:complete